MCWVLVGAHSIVLGYDGQRGAIFDKWQDALQQYHTRGETVGGNSIMADLTHGLHNKRQTYKKGDDETQVKHYKSLCGLDRCDKDVKMRAGRRMRQRYSWDRKPPTLCFCAAHKTRVAMHRYLNKLYAPASGAIEINKPEEDTKSKGLETTIPLPQPKTTSSGRVWR